MQYSLILGSKEIAQAQTKCGKYYICAIIKDEHPYIREWALYNRGLGFDKIVLYDDGSSHPYDAELGDLMRDGFVEMREWKDDRWSRQSRVYNDFVWSGDWDENDYCAFIDVDEFIFFDEAETIDKFMSMYREFAGVGLSWKMYNANGRIKSPTGIPTPQAYTTEFMHYEPRIKVIGRLKDVKTFPTVHHFVPVRGRLVTTNNRTIYGMNMNYCNYTNGHIKHYLTKSWEDWLRRLRRGNITRGLRKVETFFEFNPDMAHLRAELTKDLDYSEFPTIRNENRIWDGEV